MAPRGEHRDAQRRLLCALTIEQQIASPMARAVGSEPGKPPAKPNHNARHVFLNEILYRVHAPSATRNRADTANIGSGQLRLGSDEDCRKTTYPTDADPWAMSASRPAAKSRCKSARNTPLSQSGKALMSCSEFRSGEGRSAPIRSSAKHRISKLNRCFLIHRWSHAWTQFTP